MIPSLNYGFLKPGGAAASSLLTGLTHYWKLDEPVDTDNRVDSVGSMTFVPNGPVEVTTGIIGSAPKTRFDVGNSFAATPTGLLGSDDDFTVSIWLRNDAATTNPFLSLVDVFTIGFQLKGTAGFGTGHDFTVGNGTSTQTVSETTTYTTGNWLFVVGWHDKTADKIYLQVNNGTTAEAAWSGGTFSGASALQLGSWTAGPMHTGPLDEIGFWNRVLTSGERTSLYNSGAGLAYPF